MKYLLITVVIGAQTIFYEVSDRLIYSYELDPYIRESQLIDRVSDTLFVISGSRIKSKQHLPNQKSLGWSSGTEQIINHELLDDQVLGKVLCVEISKGLNNETLPLDLDGRLSKFRKYFISKDSEFIEKYFYTENELEYRIFTWNKYLDSDNFPFHIRTEQITDENETLKIVDVTFEEKTIDSTFRNSKILEIIENERIK